MANAYIISVKYAPGSNKEFVVFGENLSRRGISVKFILSEFYRCLEWNYVEAHYVNTSNKLFRLITDTFSLRIVRELEEVLSKFPPSFVMFYNPHPLNPRLARFIKEKYPDAITALYLHDPYKPDKSPYGWKKSVYITIAEKVQDWTVKYMDHVISPSEYSQRLFRLKYPTFKGETHLAPLLVPDTFKNHDQDRRFFSMVGGAHKATGHDTFIELVNYAAEKDLNFKFCLISSSNISGFLERLTEKGRAWLKVINKKVITDSEIDDVVRHSYAVFRLAREVTQSGVIPVSYMNATPVIATDIPGHSQHVWHGETGYLVPNNSSPQDIVQAMEYVKAHFYELSRKARKSYEEIFAEWNFDKYYGWLMKLLVNG